VREFLTRFRNGLFKLQIPNSNSIQNPNFNLRSRGGASLNGCLGLMAGDSGNLACGCSLDFGDGSFGPAFLPFVSEKD
jgi:hypothetical protein